MARVLELEFVNLENVPEFTLEEYDNLFYHDKAKLYIEVDNEKYLFTFNSSLASKEGIDGLLLSNIHLKRID